MTLVFYICIYNKSNMKLSETQEKLIATFHKHLGNRFPIVEVASPDAPITIVATDTEDKQYWIYLENKLDESVYGYDKTGIKIENVHFYHLHALMSEGSNVFWMSLFVDGYILFYLNDCLTPEQLKVTSENTLIGVSSALHIEYDETAKTIVPMPSENMPTIKGTFNDFSMN